MKLVIVESPHKATTIGNYLGKDYIVKASMGHIRDLSMRGQDGLGIDVANDFAPVWKIADRKDAVIEEFKKLSKKASEVILATDPDREGEAISWHLADILGLDPKRTKRLEFHEITKQAIEEALENPTYINEDLVYSYLARRMFDRIIGFKLSGLLSKKIGSPSAGRVQSPTLKMIVDNDKEVRSFVPEEYFTVSLSLTYEGKEISAYLVDEKGKQIEFKSKEEAEKIIEKIPSELLVKEIAKSKKTVMAKDPFTTSTLQQEASRLYHLSASKTMEIAQKLYEGIKIGGESTGLITYMRTDSTRLSERFYSAHAVPFITEKFGEAYVGKPKAAKKGALTQDAHEAIRPTGTHREPQSLESYLTPDQLKVYRLIYIRALASVMKDKILEQTEITFEGNGLRFLARGNKTIFPGYEILYKEFEEEEDLKTLPNLEKGSTLSVSKKENKQNYKPGPTPYTEGRIVRLMEEKGIGRPSTYASTIKNLLDRGYVKREKGVIVPTELGIYTTEAMDKYYSEIVSTKYTASMEATLDEIANGDLAWLNAMKDFYDPFIEKFNNVREDMPIGIGLTCPDCGSPLMFRVGKQGKSFFGCSNYPKCQYTRPLEGDGPQTLEEVCPKCGCPLVKRMNRRGKTFIGCSGYPKCDYIKIDEKKAEQKHVSASASREPVKKCPDCKTGYLVRRISKKGPFLGCTNYPHCKHVEPLEKEKK